MRDRLGCGRALLGTLLLAYFPLFVCPSRAEETEGSTPASGIRITFLPPPLEGTLSVGVYTVDGKLVRTLVREGTERDFTVGLNGFITHWDGKNDAGTALVPGKYFLRGYAVAPLDVEGVAFHGNDWLSKDDTIPRVSEIVGIHANGAELLVAGRGLGRRDCIIHLQGDAGEMKFDLFDRQALSDGAPDMRFSSASVRSFVAKSFAVPAGDASAWPGKGGTTWTIEDIPGDSLSRRRVLQRSPDRSEILRELQVEPDEPQPVAGAASLDRDEIYLLERNSKETRVRGLRLKKIENVSDGKAVSEWELYLLKSIRRFPEFQAFAPQLKRSPLPHAVERLRVSLIANELLPVAPAAVQIAVGVDENGSFLQTLDGLFLRRLTDTPHLQWATLATDRGDTISLFQSDGAVVEEYHLGKLDQMMAFDAGEYDLTAAK